MEDVLRDSALWRRRIAKMKRLMFLSLSVFKRRQQKSAITDHQRIFLDPLPLQKKKIIIIIRQTEGDLIPTFEEVPSLPPQFSGLH